MSNSKDYFDLTLEIQVNSPYKLETKNELLKMFSDEFINHGGKSVEIKDTYYMDRKSAESFQTFVIILGALGSITSITAFSIFIIQQLRKNNNKGFIFLKKKNGDYVKIDDKMTEEEVIESLEKDESASTQN